jgi:lipoprotein-anchoring transpeptidase ErfK/SrfK
MRRIFVSALLASALYVPASADPLQIAPDSYAANQSANGTESFDPRAGQGGQRYAEAREPNLGGGFIEFLFGGPARPWNAPHAYQPEQPDYQPGAAAEPNAMQSAPGSSYAAPVPGQTAHALVDPKYDRQVVAYDGDEHPGTIIIDTPHRFLYLVEGGGKALRYGIGVGRPGFTWSGVKTISAMREWPDWIPPDDMLKRRPDLPRYMAGGPENPLGARAMYLGSSLYRIHGSNEPWSIGQQVSSGCIRMRNDDVTDLYGRVKVGTKVVVI